MKVAWPCLTSVCFIFKSRDDLIILVNMSHDLELEFGKEDVIKTLNKLYEEGNHDVRN